MATFSTVRRRLIFYVFLFISIIRGFLGSPQRMLGQPSEPASPERYSVGGTLTSPGTSSGPECAVVGPGEGKQVITPDCCDFGDGDGDGDGDGCE